MSIIRASSTRRNVPITDLDEDPAPDGDPVLRAWQLGRQLGLNTELSEPPHGLDDVEQVAYRGGWREGRNIRLGHFRYDAADDIELSADDWPETDEIDGYHYVVS
jgi:hypothetical protein